MQDSVKLGTIDLSAYAHLVPRDRDTTHGKGGSIDHQACLRWHCLADYDSAFAWYKRFFGRLPDVIVSENESMWQVADAGWIYVVGDTTRAGSALLTLLVDDLEDHVAELGERGLEISTIETAPGLYRKAVITDPEGNMISFGEDLSQDA